jgi:P27 family predicted phage terminase small subunit
MTKASKTVKMPYQHSGIDHPPFLTIDGQTVFHKIVLFLKKNGNWDDAYLEMIAAASATYQNYCLAQKQVNEFGTTTETGAGGLKKNPAVDIASASFRDFMMFSNKFGLNPLFENKVSNKNADDESEI